MFYSTQHPNPTNAPLLPWLARVQQIISDFIFMQSLIKSVHDREILINMSKAEEGKVNHENEWMVRPCLIYKAEYDDCTSIKARFNQYFIFGEMLDCNQWKTDYRNCYEWEKNKSEKAYNELIASEMQRRKERLLAHYQNDVWERREKPPENWNAPLPEWMQKEFENSYLHLRNQEMKGKEIPQLNSRCTIL